MATPKTNSKKVKEHKLNKRIENDLAIVSDIKPEGHFTRIKHFANLGDIIAVLPACKKYYEVTQRKVIFVQQVNQLAQYYQGAVHPTVNSEGQNVCVNEIGFEMIKPLIESQEYIHKLEKYEGQHIDLDFDTIRGRTFVGLPNLMIQSWIAYAFPDLACDLSKSWITLPEVKNHPIKKQVGGKIIINFTERYRNDLIDYFFLQNYAPDLIFAGTEREHWLFCNKWQLTIPRLEVKDFLEYAYAIKYCRFFFGVQSFGWNIAQAIHAPRIVELCRYAPNVQPMIGEDSYGFFHQVGAEYYMRVLFRKTLRNN
jgi:hypothetical protein